MLCSVYSGNYSEIDKNLQFYIWRAVAPISTANVPIGHFKYLQQLGDDFKTQRLVDQFQSVLLF